MAYAAFKDTYFRDMINTAKTGAVSYAFGLDEEEGQHAFALDTELSPEKLFAKIRAEFGLKKGAYGTCRVEGSALVLTPVKKIKGLKGHLVELADAKGWRVKNFKFAGGEEDEQETGEGEAEEPAVAEAGDDRPGMAPEAAGLAAKAASIAKAVVVWNRTTEAATRELRKLQKAVLDLKDPRSKPVIKALEGILDRLDHVDEEAAEAEAAAREGDAAAFETARADVAAKIRAILASVQSDPVIQEADNNPLVDMKIGGTFTASLQAMLKAVS